MKNSPTTLAAPSNDTHDSLVIRYAPLILIGGLLVFAVGFAATPLTNWDTYFHLRFGSEFLNGHWSLTNPGTVTKFATAHWLPTQWSSEVVMAATEKVGGLGAVAWLFGAILITYILVLYRAGRVTAGPLAAVLSVIMAILASSSGLSARPQMVSYIFTAMTAMAWIRTGQDHRIRWWLIPLTWFWATAHGMWPTGISISVVGALALVLDWKATGRTRRNLLLVPVLSALVVAVTPVGPGLYQAVLSVNARRSNFSEWGPPNWTSLPCLALVVGLVIVIVTAIRTNEKLTWLDTGLIVIAFGWSLYSSRTVPVAAVILTPFVARTIQTWLPERANPRHEWRIIAALALIAAGILAMLVPGRANHIPSQPSWVQSSLSSLPKGTTLLDDEGYGGYLMWRFPQLQLVMDGYGDTFTNAELDRIANLTGTKPGWIADVHQTGAQWALLSAHSLLAYSLTHTQGWYVVHSSPDVVLLHAPTKR